MKRLISLTFATLAVATLNSCRADFDFEEAYISYYAESKREFTKSFVSTYGNIPSDKTWDLSSEKVHAVTRANGVTTTFVAGIDWGLSNRTTVTKNLTLYNQIKNSLPDGVKHTGNQAVLTAPANSFTIYPLTAQGGYTHDLYVKVGDEAEVKIYSKTWSDGSKPYCHGMAINSSNSVNMPGVTIDAPVGTPIHLYLKNVSGYSGRGFNIGTGTGNAIIVDCPVRPEGLPESIMPEGATLKFIGIEDCVNYSGSTVTSPGGDKDFNDLVVMIVGTPKVPEELKIENGGYERRIAKRYMIEDLGATAASDIDYNDIVVDLETYETHKTTFTNGKMTKDELVGYKKQKAIIRAMGGSLNFSLFVGPNEIFNKLEDGFVLGTMYNTGDVGDKETDETIIDYSLKLKEISLPDGTWNPTENNIWVEVITKNADDKYSISFPGTGAVPEMVAFDTDKPWNPERVGVEREWWGGQ